MFKSSAVALVALTVGLFGCGGAKNPQPVVPAASASPPASTVALTPQQEQAIDVAQSEAGGTGLSIDDAILKLCPAVKPPRFDYDSARLKTQFRDTISDLAACMKSGGLAGKDILLVGHADSRGEEDYNMALGRRRAASVRSALESFGIEASRLETTSRGALDATGTDENGWAKDRRVDIKLKT